MCIICASKKGVRQPTYAELKTMFEHNPDGAGFMFSTGDNVKIQKGFMDFESFYDAVRKMSFGKKDAVVYHFRITTQADGPLMTHPFPLTPSLAKMEQLNSTAKIGVAHNGIIQLTSSKAEKRYSDTALFISRYLSKLVHSCADLHDEYVLTAIDKLAGSKFAILDKTGYIATVGYFTDDDGLLFSNTSYKKYASYSYSYSSRMEPVVTSSNVKPRLGTAGNPIKQKSCDYSETYFDPIEWRDVPVSARPKT